ncbi:MAG TPA: PAS domain S-box protein [Burkholderiaceae bacterium]|nr:PAS domain S-box protein [Burkholderiaceae bacterium]
MQANAVVDSDEREELARYRDAIGLVGDGFFVLSPEWRLIEVNAALCAMFGRTAAEFVGHSPLEFVAESDRSLLRETLERIPTSAQRRTRYEALRADGSAFPILVRAATHRDRAGAVRGSVGFVTDLSEFEQAERATARSQRELTAILDNMQDTYYRVDAGGSLVRASKSLQRLLGYTESEAVGRDIATFYVQPGDRAQFLAALQAGGGSVSNFETWLRHHDGSKVRVSTNAHLLFDAAGSVIGVEGTARDITDLHRAREDLRLAAQVFRAATEAILITDPEFSIVSINPAFADLLGVASREAIGRPLLAFALIDGGSAGERELRNAMLVRGQWSGEVWSRRRDGIGFPCWLSLSAVRDENGNATHCVAILSDITERKATQARFEFLAHHDPLTLLPNRLLLRDRVEQSISRAARSRTALALLFLDLDGFKRVNDDFGHQTGDAVLREVGRRLLGCVRNTDTVCRHGGDEFVIALTDLSDPAYLPEIANKLRHELQLPMRIQGGEVRMRCSIGVALYPRDGRDHDALLAHADGAMYAAKRRADSQPAHGWQEDRND